MAMAELRDWQQDDDGAARANERVRHAEERARQAEEQRVQAEGRCFGAERRRLDAERRLAQVQALLDEARLAGERMRELVLELIAVAAQLRTELDRTGPQPAAAVCPDESAAAERAEMADALAAAVERLRARVAEVKAVEHEPLPVHESIRAAAVALPEARPPHKHSSSAIARWRNKRKQRQQG
jgi:chromosome segregation ATPase